ncbi:glycosyltransferase family 4 protein [Microbulbifer taiwanensis]|uniref:Glycosyltransferase family 4 protein n=1 Tax=Microbulbifer taiwanensis TaxID=986746 RepID=A0ABW1YIA3_9GAMM|nr:glycosyltransferase family 4 protein [Microbulbifer taiwanensis]
MKILIVNSTDSIGGAARAAFRLHEGLLAEGLDSTMLVNIKRDVGTRVIVPGTSFRRFLSRVRPRIESLPLRVYRRRGVDPFSLASLPFNGISDAINEINPDIVHLHWICGAMIRIEDLKRIKAPIVWSLHDEWPFTGGCHYTQGCSQYTATCGKCPILNSEKERDVSYRVFKRKLNTYNEIKELTIIGLSKWLQGRASRSPLFDGRNIVNLPNPIDVNRFQSVEKNTARYLWNLPVNKRLVLFGAMNATGDPRKGYKQLKESLRCITSSKIELVIFGGKAPLREKWENLKSHYLGEIYNDGDLATLYSAADVLVVPSLEENLSNVIMEAMSCSLPVVAFDIGGNSDLIDHKTNGYLAKREEAKDLARGIEWVLENNENSKLSINSRIKVESYFDSRIVIRKYMQLYESVLKNK